MAAKITVVKQCARLCIAAAGTSIHEGGMNIDGTTRAIQCGNDAKLQVSLLKGYFPPGVTEQAVLEKLEQHKAQSWEYFVQTKSQCSNYLGMYNDLLDSTTHQPKSGKQWADVLEDVARTWHEKRRKS